MTAYSGSDREHREGCREQDAAPNDDYKYAANQVRQLVLEHSIQQAADRVRLAIVVQSSRPTMLPISTPRPTTRAHPSNQSHTIDIAQPAV
jgi:hypothetical protein